MPRQNQSANSVVFGLERVPFPAIVTDNKGDLVWANDRFRKAVGARELNPGIAVKTLLPQTIGIEKALSVVSSSPTAEPPTVIIRDLPYTLHVEPIGMLKGAVFVPAAESHAPQQERRTASGLPPAANRILEALYRLSEQLNRGNSEEDIILLFIRVYKELFPNRLLCIKLFDQETMGFQQVYANGRLREESHSAVRLTRRAVMENGLDTESGRLFLRESRVFVTKEYLPIFEDGIAGFDIPLFDGATFYGILNFEYRKGASALTMDRAIAIPVAHQMSASLRYTALISETTFLKDYLEKLLDQANAPVLVVDGERRITVFNQAMERLTGYNRDAYLGRDLITLIPESEKERIASVMLRVMLGDQQTGIEISLPRADKTGDAHLVFNLAPIQSGESDMEGIILVGQDLTEIKRLQQQVIRSEKLATLGQVAAGVAHEVSNPLTFVSVYANYLYKKLNGVVDSADLEKIKRIMEAAARIQTFTRELVTYGRPSREKSTLIDVQSLLERALSFCEHLIAQSNARVSLTVEKGIRQIFGIRGHLEQVFVNLITNACHALDEMGGELRVKAHTKGNELIVIAVEDTGCGIAKENLETIFEPFFTTKPEGLGTGLGLSIVRNIVIDHKGDIAVESTVEKGTIFTLTLPAN